MQGGMLLAEWCLSNPTKLAGYNIVELGSGCGLTGIAVSRSINVKSFTFTDHHKDVLQQLKINLNLNNLTSGEVHVSLHCW